MNTANARSAVWYGTVESFTAAARKIAGLSDRIVGGYVLGCYYLHAVVAVQPGGKGRVRNFKVCVHSGNSANPGHAVAAVGQIPGCLNAHYNLD